MVDQALEDTTAHFGDGPSAAVAGAETAGQRTQRAHDVEQSLEQRHKYAGREWSSDHSLNIRISIPLGVGRYYITLVAGKERRARARLALDRRQHPLDTPGNVLFLAFVVTIATAGSATLFYFLLAHLFGWSGRLML